MRRNLKGLLASDFPLGLLDLVIGNERLLKTCADAQLH